MHRSTCDWLGDQPTGGSNTQDHNWVDLQPESAGSQTPAGRQCKYWKGKTILWEQKKLMLYQGAIYHCHTHTSKLEEVLQFAVPKAQWVAALKGCHCDAGHQGKQQTLCLLPDQFWWLSMVTQMQRAITSCEQSIQHESIQTKTPCNLSFSLHLWSCCMLTLPALRPHCSWINPQTWWTFWSFMTTLWNTS